MSVRGLRADYYDEQSKVKELEERVEKLEDVVKGLADLLVRVANKDDTGGVYEMVHNITRKLQPKNYYANDWLGIR